VLAQVAEPEAWQLVVLEQGVRRLRHESLTAVARRHDPRRAMEAQAVVALVAHARLACMEPDAHAQFRTIRPPLLG
jgi:hypothetical protein